MPLRIAILGTRGIPANYGGFETFAEELAKRLVLRGHDVTVYGRSHYVRPDLREYCGVKLERRRSIRTKHLETVSHTCISVLSASFRPHDAVLICNAVNAFVAWVPRLRGQKVILNVDGLEWKRQKWGWLGRAVYRLSARLATICPNRVVTDARTVQDYYRERFSAATSFIPYGASLTRSETTRCLDELGLQAGQYFLYVSRLEPENNAHLVIRSYLESGLELPLVVVGDAPYARKYISQLRDLARHGNVRMPGAIFGEGYRELQSHALCYFHGTEVGGTHPALLEAMGVGGIVVANDTPENREVVRDSGILCVFKDRKALARIMQAIALHPSSYQHYRTAARERVKESYSWSRVTDQYEELFNEVTGKR